MIDFVVVTNDALRFHQANLLKNGHHYSYSGGFVKFSPFYDKLFRFKRPKNVANLQTNWGARIFYNTQIFGTLFPIFS